MCMHETKLAVKLKLFDSSISKEYEINEGKKLVDR